MTLRKHISMRTLFLSLLLATPFLGVACLDPELKDAEIGCGVDAMVNAKCPNRPPVEAGPPTPDASPVTPDSAIEDPDAPTVPADTAADQAVVPVTPDASLADRAIDGPGLTGSDGRPDGLPGSDVTLD
jgi:hypothetical protein